MNTKRFAMAIAAALVVAASPAAAAPKLFVYRGAGCTGRANLIQWESVTGQPPDGVVDFVDYTSSWPSAVSEANWALGCWQGKTPNIALSVPLEVAKHNGSALQDAAAGADDAYATQIAKSLVAHGFPNAYVRLGWEFNGGWYPWSAAKSPKLFAKAFAQFVTAMRAVPGANFKFVWNPALYEQQFWPDQAYPGDQFVDIIATDVYNASWKPNTTHPTREPALWDSVSGDSWGVNQVMAFAKAHGKPYAFPEWGTGERPDGHGGGDDPTFVTNMAPLIRGAVFAGLWDYNAGDYNSQMSDGTHPKATAAYLRAFTPSQMKDLISSRNPDAAAAAELKTACTNCHTAVIPDGDAHWKVVVWAYALHPSATFGWGFSARTVNIRDPADPKMAFRLLKDAQSATLALKPGRPLVIEISK